MAMTSPINDLVYDRLVRATLAMRDRVQPPDPALRTAAEAVLFVEARLLDERRYQEWVDLFADDGVYWVPIHPEVGDPRQQVSLACDDRRRLQDRIARLDTGWAHSQLPASRTVRAVTNVEAWRGDDDSMEIRSNLVVHEFRRGRHQTFAGRQEHAIVEVDGVPRITRKVVHLIDADFAVGNVSFVL
jgi:3-phenylpropionate/cinnamic acid dioxygenase small subunit